MNATFLSTFISALPKRTQDYLRSVVQKGAYVDELEAIEAAVDAKIIRDQELWLREQLEEGLTSGPSVSMTKDLGRRLTEEGIARAKADKGK